MADLIAQGHAQSKHAGDSPGMSVDDLVKLTQDVMTNPSRTKDLARGRKAYLGKDGTTFVVHNPNAEDAGSIYRLDPTKLEDYWAGLE
ncbi:hypothetical protein [Streptomyces violascens]|uniref:hypothetical protein n=1 Tax=Streptomyces violascens TaxID=67381 RepID=UPI0036C2D10E